MTRGAGLSRAASALQVPSAEVLQHDLKGAAELIARKGARRWGAQPAAAGEPVVANAVAFARENEHTVLIYATSTPDEVKAVQQQLGVERAGTLVENALGEIAQALRESGVRRFVVAGGETSGAVVKALGVQLLHIGAQIDPGVPATVSDTQEPLALALKSGNFGGRDFFAKALKQLAGGAQ